MPRKLPEPLIATIIIGNGWTHTRYGNIEKHFPSVIGPEQSVFNDVDFGNDEEFSPPLVWDGTPFVGGYEAYRRSRMPSGSMGADKIGSVTHRRLFLWAMYKLFGARDVEPDMIVTTLPVLEYDSIGQRDKVKNLLAGDYTLTAGGREFTYSVSPDAIKVLPEGLPTVYDVIYNAKLKVQTPTLTKDAVGVVNIGTVTTDFIFIENQRPNTAFCRSVNYGLSKVWSDVIQKAQQLTQRALTAHEADEAVKQGFFYSGKKKIDVREWADAGLEQVAEAIALEIAQLWDNGRAVQHMIEAGGGGPQMHIYLATRYDPIVEYHSYKTIPEAAATEMNGAHKFAMIRAMQTA